MALYDGRLNVPRSPADFSAATKYRATVHPESSAPAGQKLAHEAALTGAPVAPYFESSAYSGPLRVGSLEVMHGPDRIEAVGGAETPDVGLSLHSPTAEVGLITERGHGYKPYNEDGAIAGVAPLPYVVVADQAGGMGSLEGSTGLASEIAARAIQQAAHEISRGAHPPEALRNAALRADREVRALNAQHHINSATTLVGGVLVNGTMHVVNVGDSQAMLVSAAGEIKAQTTPHSFEDELLAGGVSPALAIRQAAILTQAVGSGSKPVPDVYQWDVSPGDSVAFFSDGVLDANLKGQQAAYARNLGVPVPHGELTRSALASEISSAGSARVAAMNAQDYALRHAISGEGKPDNSTAAVLRVRDPAGS